MWERLPPELLSIVCESMRGRTIANVSMVCRAWSGAPCALLKRERNALKRRGDDLSRDALVDVLDQCLCSDDVRMVTVLALMAGVDLSTKEFMTHFAQMRMFLPNYIAHDSTLERTKPLYCAHPGTVRSALAVAVSNGAVKCARKIIALGANITRYEWFALFWLCLCALRAHCAGSPHDRITGNAMEDHEAKRLRKRHLHMVTFLLERMPMPFMRENGSDTTDTEQPPTPSLLLRSILSVCDEDPLCSKRNRARWIEPLTNVCASFGIHLE